MVDNAKDVLTWRTHGIFAVWWWTSIKPELSKCQVRLDTEEMAVPLDSRLVTTPLLEVFRDTYCFTMGRIETPVHIENLLLY